MINAVMIVQYCLKYVGNRNKIYINQNGYFKRIQNGLKYNYFELFTIGMYMKILIQWNNCFVYNIPKIFCGQTASLCLADYLYNTLTIRIETLKKKTFLFKQFSVNS